MSQGMECVGSTQNVQAPIDFENDPYLYEKMSWCYFPGAPIFKVRKARLG